jgi:hypothetical protein
LNSVPFHSHPFHSPTFPFPPFPFPNLSIPNPFHSPPFQMSTPTFQIFHDDNSEDAHDRYRIAKAAAAAETAVVIHYSEMWDNPVKFMTALLEKYKGTSQKIIILSDIMCDEEMGPCRCGKSCRELCFENSCNKRGWYRDDDPKEFVEFAPCLCSETHKIVCEYHARLR